MQQLVGASVCASMSLSLCYLSDIIFFFSLGSFLKTCATKSLSGIKFQASDAAEQQNISTYTLDEEFAPIAARLF